jgi:hypothetical protein
MESSLWTVLSGASQSASGGGSRSRASRSLFRQSCTTSTPATTATGTPILTQRLRRIERMPLLACAPVDLCSCAAERTNPWHVNRPARPSVVVRHRRRETRSSRTQSSYRLPWKNGQASPQPMVTITSESWAVACSSLLGVWSVMSMPTSRVASTATGFMVSAGSDPAERTRPVRRPGDAAIRPPSASGRRCVRRRTAHWASRTRWHSSPGG